MPNDRNPDGKLEADGVLVRPIGGQIYLIEEGVDADETEEAPPADRSPLFGLIHRH